MSSDLKHKLFDTTECISEQTMYNYIDKKLLPKEEHLVEKHLLDCDLCNDALEGLRLTKNRNRIHAINAEIDKKLSKKSAKIVYFNYKSISAIAASLVLLIGAVVFFKQFTKKEAKQSDMAILTPTAKEKTLNEKESELNAINKNETTGEGLKDNISKEITDGKNIDFQEKSAKQLGEPDATTISSNSSSAQSGSSLKDEEGNAEGGYKYSVNRDDLSKNKAETKENKEKEQSYFATEVTASTPSVVTVNKSNNNSFKNKNAEDDKKTESPQKALEESVSQKSDANQTLPSDKREEAKEIAGKKAEKKVGGKSKDKTRAAGTGATNEQQIAQTPRAASNADLDGLLTADSTSTLVLETPETPAQFPGGNDSLHKYIVKNFKYTTDNNNEKINSTKIIVQFIVDTKGKIQKAKIIKGINPTYDAEALRIINDMPNWQPAKQNGKVVTSKVTLPIQLEIK